MDGNRVDPLLQSPLGLCVLNKSEANQRHQITSTKYIVENYLGLFLTRPVFSTRISRRSCQYPPWLILLSLPSYLYSLRKYLLLIVPLLQSCLSLPKPHQAQALLPRLSLTYYSHLCAISTTHILQPSTLPAMKSPLHLA